MTKRTQPQKGDLVETINGTLGEVYSARTSQHWGWLVRLLGRKTWEPLDHIVVQKEERGDKVKQRNK